MYRILTVWFIFIFYCCCAAGQIPVGAWRDHLSYTRATGISLAGDRIYCAAGTGMTVYNKGDKSIEKLSKVHGLSDVDISSIRWSDKHQLLIVGYANGNIDILDGNRIINLSDILRSPVPGSKSINNIMVAGNIAYLSCSFGIVTVNLERYEIGDTYFLGDGGIRLAIHDMAFDGSFLYAATSSGLYRADINAPNLLDFAYWDLLDFLPEPESVVSSLAWFGGKLYAVRMAGSGNYNSYRIDGVSWEYFAPPSGHPVKFSVSGDHLVLIGESEAGIYGPGAEFIRKIDDYGLWAVAIRDIEIDDDGVVWIADRVHGLVRGTGNSYSVLTPPGPWSNRVFSVASYPGRTYFAAGGRTQAFGNLWLNGEYSIFSQESWSSRLNYDIRDVLYIIEHPADPEILFLAAWGYGLVEYRGGKFHDLYGENNSSLSSIIPGGDFIRIGGMAFDDGNNLWLTNSGVPEPVSVLQANGDWVSFPYGALINHAHIGRLIINRLGQKWALLPRGGGLFVFENRGNLSDTSQDLTRRLSITDETRTLISNEVFSIAEDQRGYIWVGTNNGVAVYYNPANVFSDENFHARRIVVSGTREGDVGYLLNNETVTAIAVDGADRKWFGTEKSGVFLVSADGTRQIHHFTMHNSPLLSNIITDIAIEPSTGEVFFGTSNGVVSFRGSATEASAGFRDVYVFPNPVRENYDGPVTVTGLMKDSVVKITDISGNLVYETVSLGGQAVWDGRNFRGRRVQTGIYLVFISSPDGSETHVSKLLFIH